MEIHLSNSGWAPDFRMAFRQTLLRFGEKLPIYINLLQGKAGPHARCDLAFKQCTEQNQAIKLGWHYHSPVVNNHTLINPVINHRKTYIGSQNLVVRHFDNPSRLQKDFSFFLFSVTQREHLRRHFNRCSKFDSLILFPL